MMYFAEFGTVTSLSTYSVESSDAIEDIYCKGKCLAKNSISSKKLEPVVIAGIKAATLSNDLSFAIKNPIPVEDKSELKILEGLLAKMESKEKRIKDAYMNGIDSMEEYKENKLLLSKERADLEERIKNTNTEPEDNMDIIKNDMKKRIQNVYEIITSDDFSNQEKSDALKSAVEKIVYKKEDGIVDICYYYL